MLNRIGAVVLGAVLVVAAASFGDAARAQMGSVNLDVPAYHTTPPKGRLAPTLPPSDFPNAPETQRAYAAAAKIKPILYQMPCYCHCDKEVGHTSLLSCYQDRHASICSTCKMELYYAYIESRKGMTALEIRAGIMRGDWQKVDMSGWSAPYPAAAAPAKKPASPKS